MQLITFIESDRSRAGILKEDGVIDLSIACPGLPSEMLALIQAGPRAIACGFRQRALAAFPTNRGHPRGRHQTAAKNHRDRFELPSSCRRVEYGAARGAFGLYQAVNFSKWALQSDLLV